MKTVKAIMACDAKFGIGKNGTIPWGKNKEDLREFRDLTSGNVVIMGSKTWNDEMFPKPLPNRKCYVMTRNQEFFDNRANIISQNHHHSIREIIEETKQDGKILWVIGGSEIIEELLPYIEEYHLTVMDDVHNCDKYIRNPMDLGFKEIDYQQRSYGVKYIYSK